VEMQHEQLWALLQAEPGVGVICVGPEGDLRYVNRQAAWLYTGDADVEWQGKSVEDFYEAGAAAERQRLIRRVLETNKPAILRHVRLGRQLQATFWPVTAETPANGREAETVESVLVITREGETEPRDGEDFEIVESEYIDLGPLDALSRRELEVLALLGQGLSISKIAETLHRSAKTIEKHRHSIGKKLNASNRVELARLANMAGLEVSDAGKTRDDWRQDDEAATEQG